MLRSTDIPLLYVDCDIPDGVTLTEWRREKAAADLRDRAEARADAREARARAFRRRLPRLRPAPALRPRFA
jgi:hypothetical protein